MPLSLRSEGIDNRQELARLGCPVGTLCSELHKDGGPVARKATILFAEALTWIEAQFRPSTREPKRAASRTRTRIMKHRNLMSVFFFVTLLFLLLPGLSVGSSRRGSCGGPTPVGHKDNGGVGPTGPGAYQYSRTI